VVSSLVVRAELRDDPGRFHWTYPGSAFLGLLPEALELRAGPDVPATILVGILAFFVLEKLVLWRHSHDIDPGENVASGEPILQAGAERLPSGQRHPQAGSAMAALGTQPG